MLAFHARSLEEDDKWRCLCLSVFARIFSLEKYIGVHSLGSFYKRISTNPAIETEPVQTSHFG